MEGLNQVQKFIEEAEKFKSTEKYQSMPNEQRDFLNEELGRFKLMVELTDISSIFYRQATGNQNGYHDTCIAKRVGDRYDSSSRLYKRWCWKNDAGLELNCDEIERKQEANTSRRG